MLKTDFFTIIRVLIGLTAVDGKVHEKEIAWVRHYISKNKLTEDQLRVLDNDLASPPEVLSLFKNINSFYDRERILGLARVIFHIDGVFDPNEKKMFAEMTLIHQNKSKNLKQLFANYGSELTKRDNNMSFWSHFSNLGTSFSIKPSWYEIQYPGTLLFREILKGNSFLLWFLIAFTLFAGLLKVILPRLLYK